MDPNRLGNTRPSNYSGSTGTQKSKYLPQLKLLASTSVVCQEGKAMPGTFAANLTKEVMHVFGQAVDLYAYACKDMAIGKLNGETVRSYDAESDEFKQIIEKSETSKGGYQYGTVFLIFERTLGIPMEFFCGNTSSRIEIPHISAFLPINDQEIARRQAQGQDVSGLKASWANPFTLTGTLKKGTANSYFIPVATACKTPFANQPKFEDIEAWVNKFLDIPVEEDAPASRPR